MSLFYLSDTLDSAKNEMTEAYIRESFPGETTLFVYQNEEGSGVLGFSIISDDSRTDTAAQTAIVQQALHYLDIDSRTDDHGHIAISSGVVSMLQQAIEGGRTVNKGLIVLEGEASAIRQLSAAERCKFSGLTKANKYVSRPYLIAALKYAFELSCGKSDELEIDFEEVYNQAQAE